MKHVDQKIVSLFADGGVIGINPSSIGGTYAWCGVSTDGERIIERSGVIASPDGRLITNNHTEMIAIVLALEAMEDGWSGTIHSDSMISLGRLFKGWNRKNLPANIYNRAVKALERLGHVDWMLLQGHPTKKDLEIGIGKKRGLPVSKHQDWCDKACGKQSYDYMVNLGIRV